MDYYKVMALDYGEVRIGVAMTDLMRLIASPFETYVRKSLDQDLDHICALIKNNSVKTVVVGLPLNMDGTEGERAQKTREFVDVLKTKQMQILCFKMRDFHPCLLKSFCLKVA